MSFSDEITKHLTGNIEIGDDPVPHRPDGKNVSGRSTQHLFSFTANGQDPFLSFRIPLNGHHRGFGKEDPFPLYINEVFAVPKSMARSVENRPQSASNTIPLFPLVFHEPHHLNKQFTFIQENRIIFIDGAYFGHARGDRSQVPRCCGQVQHSVFRFYLQS